MAEALHQDLKAISEVFWARAWPRSVAAIEKQVKETLTKVGFSGETEQTIHYGSRVGRINLVVQRSGPPVAIEIDRLSARQKSILKLRSFDGLRMIVLRRGLGAKPGPIAGIDLVISIEA